MIIPFRLNATHAFLVAISPRDNNESVADVANDSTEVQQNFSEPSARRIHLFETSFRKDENGLMRCANLDLQERREKTQEFGCD